LGTEDDDFCFEGVWGLWRGHVLTCKVGVLSWGVSCRSQKLRVSYLLLHFSRVLVSGACNVLPDS
jgi:hypothetical protein